MWHGQLALHRSHVLHGIPPHQALHALALQMLLAVPGCTTAELQRSASRVCAAVRHNTLTRLCEAVLPMIISGAASLPTTPAVPVGPVSLPRESAPLLVVAVDPMMGPRACRLMCRGGVGAGSAARMPRSCFRISANVGLHQEPCSGGKNALRVCQAIQPPLMTCGAFIAEAEPGPEGRGCAASANLFATCKGC